MFFIDFLMLAICFWLLSKLFFVIVIEMPNDKITNTSSAILAFLVAFTLSGMLTSTKIGLAYIEFIQNGYTLEEVKTPSGEIIVNVKPIPFEHAESLSLWEKTCWLFTHADFTDLKDFRTDKDLPLVDLSGVT